ncbi:unnamed protein product [Toxocara canis]|uniref:Transposase n=1 Tax=Toxocara canis TaxID=6265 RepID=A0A183UEB6_TOXCA|nr:unnamed protein product [Toxocara canis]
MRASERVVGATFYYSPTEEAFGVADSFLLAHSNVPEKQQEAGQLFSQHDSNGRYRNCGNTIEKYGEL